MRALPDIQNIIVMVIVNLAYITLKGREQFFCFEQFHEMISGMAVGKKGKVMLHQHSGYIVQLPD